MKIITAVFLTLGCFFSGTAFAAEELTDYIKPGYSNEEIECLQRAAEIDPGNFGIYYGLGMAYYRKGEFGKVVECHQKFTQLLDSPRAYRNLERVYRKIGDYSRAKEYARKAEEYERKNGLPSPSMAETVNDSRQIEALSKLIQINPGIGALYGNLEGAEAAEKKDLAEEIGLLQKALAIDPENFGIYYGLGVAYYRNEEYDRAVDYCLKFTQANPGCGLTFYALGVAYYQIGDPATAQEQANQLRSISRFDLAERLEATISGVQYQDNNEREREEASRELRRTLKKLQDEMPFSDDQEK